MKYHFKCTVNGWEHYFLWDKKIEKYPLDPIFEYNLRCVYNQFDLVIVQFSIEHLFRTASVIHTYLPHQAFFSNYGVCTLLCRVCIFFVNHRICKYSRYCIIICFQPLLCAFHLSISTFDTSTRSLSKPLLFKTVENALFVWRQWKWKWRWKCVKFFFIKFGMFYLQKVCHFWILK